VNYWEIKRWIKEHDGADLSDGDLIYVEDGRLKRLTLGTDGQVLTARPATTPKLEWTDPASGPGGGGDDVSVNGTGVSGANFRDGTPSAPANAQNVTWQASGSGPASISGYIAADGSTVEFSGGALQIKSLGVNTGQLAALGVTTAKIDNLAVTTGKIADDAVTYAKLQDTATAKRVLGAASAGTPGEVSAETVHDWIGTPAQGDLIYRNATAPVRLVAGTAGQVLQTGGAGANPSWASVGALVGIALPYLDMPEAIPTGLTTGSFVAPSHEFRTAQSYGGFTNVYDHGTLINPTPSIVEGGFQTFFPSSGASTVRTSGHYHSTNPFSQDLMIATCVTLVGGPSTSCCFGVSLFQDPTSSTGDMFSVQASQGSSGTGQNARIATYTAYNGATFTLERQTSGKIFVYILYNFTTQAVSVYTGAHPDAMSFHGTSTLAFTPTKIGFIGQGGNGPTCFGYVSFLRIYALTYSTQVSVKLSGAKAQ
jgi:hypothetical protein